MEPQESDVNSMQEILGCSRTEAIQFLKRYVTIESAANAYMDSGGILPPEAEPLKWDESHFHAERDPEYGPMNKPNAGAFNIESSDTLNPGVFSSAPTRPSSRASNYISNTPKEGGDVMTMSRHSAGQEMGVTTGAPYFGPATQSHYDDKVWALTVAPHRETHDPDVRKREPGVPVIMKPMSGADSLPALITILQAIPMAREALLARDFLARDYGKDSDWWDGSPIRLPRVVHIDYPNEDSSWEDIIYETQRMMAFMEHTDRAYGSAHNIMPIPGVGDVATTKQGEFLRQWHNSMTKAAPDDELAGIFKTTAHNDPTVVLAGEEDSTTIYEVRVDISERGHMLGSSLYEHLDDTLWAVDLEGGEPKNIYMEPGEILVFQAESRNRDEPGLGIDIPAELYSDRYLQEKMETTKLMRKERMKRMTAANERNEQQQRLRTIAHPKTGKLIDAGELLEYVGQYFTENSEQTGKIGPESRGEMLLDVSDENMTFKYSDVAKELKDVVEKITEALNALEEAKKEAVTELRELSELFKHPSTDPELHPTHRYTLRGVSTNQNTTYILSNPNTTDDLIGTDPEDWIWWKMTYDAAARQPVKHEQVTESDVLLAAKHDSRSVLLVYASDKAVSYPSRALPSQLKNFVRGDNLLFEKELRDHMSTTASNHVEMDDQDLEERRRLISDEDDDFDDVAADAEPLQINLDSPGDSDPPTYETVIRGGSSSPDSLIKGDNMEDVDYTWTKPPEEWHPMEK